MPHTLAYCRTMLGELEERKQSLLAETASWPEDRRGFSPGPGAWSALQVIEHLIKTEEAILTSMRAGLGQPHRRGPRDLAGVWFLDRVFRSPRRVKTPASASRVLPGDPLGLKDLTARWDAVRRELDEVIAGLAPEQTRGGVFRHSVAGWMRVGDTLNFFSVHLIHHRFQLARIRDASAGLTS